MQSKLSSSSLCINYIHVLQSVTQIYFKSALFNNRTSKPMELNLATLRMQQIFHFFRRGTENIYIYNKKKQPEMFSDTVSKKMAHVT